MMAWVALVCGRKGFEPQPSYTSDVVTDSVVATLPDALHYGVGAGAG